MEKIYKLLSETGDKSIYNKKKRLEIMNKQFEKFDKFSIDEFTYETIDKHIELLKFFIQQKELIENFVVELKNSVSDCYGEQYV